MEPIGFNYLPPLPDLNQGHPPHHQNTPSLPESVTGWSTFCEQMDCNPLQHPPPPPKHSQEQPPRHYANATDWNAHHGQFNPNPQQQPQQSYYPYPLMQHLPSRLPMNAAGYNKNCVVDGNDNTISIGGNLSNNTNNVQLHIFPKIASVPIVPNCNTAKTKETKPVTNNICTVQLCSDGKTVLLPHSFMPINKNLITCEHAKAYIHLWPKLDPKQVEIGGGYEITDVEIEAFQEYLKELFNYVQSVGREALKQHIVRNFRHEGFTVNGVPLAAFDDVSEVLKSDLFKGQGPRAMEVMFQLIHSNNHETSSFVKDMLPVVVNKAGTSPPFSMPFAISNNVQSNRVSNRRGGNHSLVRVANSGSEKIMEQFRTLSLSTFGMYVSKTKLVPKGLDAIIVPTNYYQKYHSKDSKCYLIVSKHILCEALQNSDKVTLEDIEKISAHSKIHPMFSKHLFDYATTAIVAGLTLNEAFIHLKETYNAITPSFKHSSVLTPPVKCIEQKKMHSPPVPFNLPAIMSKTVPLKTTESEEQEPVLPSTINMPSTSRNTDVFEINDEFCSFDIIMPQEAVALKIGEQEESVRSVFPLFLSHFHLSVCAMRIT